MDPGTTFESEVLLGRIEDSAAFAKHWAAADARRAVEELLAEDEPERPRSLAGFCRSCGEAVLLSLPGSGPGMAPNFREALVCPSCGLNNRQRFMASYAVEEMQQRGGGARLYAYEQMTAFYQRLRERYGERAVGSEYVSAETSAGQLVDGVRHEDATALSFDDASFDVLVSNDVFEHVPDIAATLAEARRVLRPGGVLLFSVPFFGTGTSEVCAKIVDGEVRHLRDDPEYHGDPAHDGGSLVFYRFGWDLLDMCRAAGFHRAAMIAYYSMLYGHLGGGIQYVFRADARPIS